MFESPLTIIVPTLNARHDLETLQAGLDATGDPRLTGDRLISDGGSCDGTVAAARRRGWRVVMARRGRGSQLAAGAAAARTPWLLFLHADSILRPGWVRVVDTFIAEPANAEKAGYFRFALAAPQWRARWLELMVLLRCHLCALPYGDQGLLIRRDFYHCMGGHADMPLMEDVDLARRLGRRRLIALAAELGTSPLRYQERGYARRIVRNALCLAAYYVGADPRRIADFYGPNSGTTAGVVRADTLCKLDKLGRKLDKPEDSG